MQTLRRIPSWLWLVGIAGALRFINLGSESLWYDETFTATVAKLPINRLFAALQGDVHPPLWYLIEWANIRVFGTSEFALRLPSAILGIVAVLLVWRLALAIGFTRRTAFVAGLLAAVFPMNIYYGQEARMYALLSCFVLWAELSAVKDRWLWFAVASAGVIYSQNLGLLYVGAMGIAVVLSRLKSWRSLVKPVLAGVGIVAAWSPWLSTVIKQAGAVKAGFWIQPLTAGAALWPLPTMTMGMRIPAELQAHVYGVAIGFTLIGLIACRKWLISRSGLIVLSVTFGMPILMALVSVYWRSIYLPRAVLPSALMLCLIWAYPLQHLSKPNRRLAQAIVAPMIALGIVGHYLPAQARPDARAWVAPIQANWQAGDAVYFITIDSTVLYSFYLPNKPFYLLPEATDLNQSLTAETKTAMGLNERSFDDLPQTYRRAWLITALNPLTSRAESEEAARIIDQYHATLIAHEGNEYLQQAIYLIDYAKAND